MIYGVSNINASKLFMLGIFLEKPVLTDKHHNLKLYGADWVG